MIVPTGTRIWLVAGATDMRRGYDGLAALVQTHLSANPFSGELYIFRGRRGDRIKCLWYDGTGVCLFCKRLEGTHFVWPQTGTGTVLLTAAQLSMLLEGLERRRVQPSWKPQVAV
jgi:transposase